MNKNNKQPIGIGKIYQSPRLKQQPDGAIRKYYLDGEFEKRSDEVLAMSLPGEEKKPTLIKTLFSRNKKY